MTYFIINKLYNIDNFIDNCIKDKINEKIIIPNRNKNNQGHLTFIINLFWPYYSHYNFKYFFDNGFFNITYGESILKIPEKDLTFDKNMISSYLEKTADNYLEPNYQNFLNSIKLNFGKFFYNYLYPIIYFNFSLYIFYSNIRFFNFFKKIVYKNYIDFFELIQAINETKFHKNENFNSLFRIRAIDYFINGNSLIKTLILELLNILFMKSENLIYIKNIRFKIKIIDNNQDTSTNTYSQKVPGQKQEINSKKNTYGKLFKNEINEIKKSYDINYSNRNLFDSLFSITRISKANRGNIRNYLAYHELCLIEIRQNDISHLLKLYLEKYNYNLDSLLFDSYFFPDYELQNKILEKLLDKIIIYPLFKLTKESEDDRKDVGIIKLHKGY